MRPLELLENELGYHFKDAALLEQALTHSSSAHERGAQEDGTGGSRVVADNEQLEFLGDAVLGFVTSRFLYDRFPDFREGQLSKLRAYLVSARHLIEVARLMELGAYLQLGEGEERSGGRQKPSLLVDGLEALIAALYLDGGLEAAERFITERVLAAELEELDRTMNAELTFTDYKSALQEWTQSRNWEKPEYEVVLEQGPEHRKLFTAEVRIKGQEGLSCSARGEGQTKKKAEQVAAQLALEKLREAVPGQE